MCLLMVVRQMICAEPGHLEFVMIMCFYFQFCSQGFFRAYISICIYMLHDFQFPSTIPTDTSGSARKEA